MLLSPVAANMYLPHTISHCFKVALHFPFNNIIFYLIHKQGAVHQYQFAILIVIVLLSAPLVLQGTIALIDYQSNAQFAVCAFIYAAIIA